MSNAIEVIVPGVYDLPEEIYHADPVPGGSLSVSGAKKLLPPLCPRIFDYERRHGEKHKRTFDVGKAAHLLVLGVGPELYVVGEDNYKKSATREERDEAYARGAVPLTPEEFDTVQAMAAELRRHPRAPELFAEGGVAEQSLFWTDGDTGVMCRARLDYLTDRIVDYKTTTNVSLGAVSKTIDSLNYHMQADWYLDGAVDRDVLPPDAQFVFVFQSKEPPYLVRAVDLDDVALKVGRERNRLAREIYRDCKAVDVWPGYSDDIETVSLPGYSLRRYYYEGILS